MEQASTEKRITQILQQRFHIDSLYPFQRLVIQRIIEEDTEDRDHISTLVILPTGGGKSLCFMLPSLLVEGITVLVYPLLSLMNDQVRRLEEAGIGYVCIQGGQKERHRRQLINKLYSKEARVLVTNAECLRLHSVLSGLSRLTISLLVLDEAHTIVSWGEGFRPALADIGTILAHLPIRHILCFTATADQHVLSGLNRLIFHGTPDQTIHAKSDRPNISYHVIRTLSKSHSIANIVNNKHMLPALVFCKTRKESENQARQLCFNCPNIPVRYYHAGLGKQERKYLEQWFTATEHAVMFATKAFGMGIDIKSIRSVIHYSLSEDVLSFIQESGRAGRDGKPAQSLVLLDGNESPSLLLSIFQSQTKCFRCSLLQAMQEELEFCNGCDICDQTLQMQREAEQAFIFSVLFHPLTFTPSSLIEMLITPDNWHSYGGTLTHWSLHSAREALSCLQKEGIICIAKHTKRRLYVAPKRTLSLLTSRSTWKSLKL